MELKALLNQLAEKFNAAKEETLQLM